jgi:nitroreductase
MEFLELVKKRYSVRDYLDTPLDDALIEKVLDAGRLAPSACNYQPWVFIVVKKEDSRRKFETVYGRAWFIHAPVIVAVCCDRSLSWHRKADGKDFGEIDIAIALDHITLAATEIGLGTCWIGNFNVAEAAKLLMLPASIEPIVFTPLGYPGAKAQKPPKNRKSLDEIVHWEVFGGKRKVEVE